MISRVFTAGWLMVLAFCFSIAEVAVEYKLFGPSKPVTAEEKKDAVLQCRVEPELDVTSLTVEWKLQDKLVHRYRSRDDDLAFQNQQFKGRTSLFRKEMVQGNIHLKLTNVTPEDAGNYTCIVSKLQGQVKKATVTLNVGKVNHQEEDLEKGPSTGTIVIIAVIIIIGVVVVTAGGYFLWKCPTRSETAEQSQQYESTELTETVSDAEPKDSPLRHRNTAIPKNDNSSTETISNSATSPT